MAGKHIIIVTEPTATGGREHVFKLPTASDVKAFIKEAIPASCSYEHYKVIKKY